MERIARQRIERPLARLRAPALGFFRLAVAVVVLSAAAYVLSWQILYDGPLGNDAPYHLHLAQWIDSSFPSVHWWYRWDDHGIPYREGYPLAAHWIAVAIARAGALDVSKGIQMLEFAITPLGALGIYAFCAWRLRRPLAGLVAGLAYLLSTITWSFLIDWGFLSNQAGTVLFMPVLFALDVFFEEWSAGRRGWRYRLAALAVMSLIALMGLVAPFQLGAGVAAIFLYVFAIGGGSARARVRWLLLTAPLLVGGSFLLTAFWSLPQEQYLSFIASRVPPRTFDPGQFQVYGIDQLFALHPARVTVTFDRMAISPAVWIPAIAGVVAAWWNPRLRVVIALVAFGLLTVLTSALDALVWNVPVLPYLVHTRVGVTLIQFLIPVLAGIGVTETPGVLGVWLSALVRFGRRGRSITAASLILVALTLEVVAVGQFAHWVAGHPNRLAYGGNEVDSNDIWSRYDVGVAPPADLSTQLLDSNAWRPIQVGCLSAKCHRGAADLSVYQGLFSAPPQRALVDAHVPLLLMNFQDLTGGSQAYTYNFQLPASPELDNWMLDSMLSHRGSAVKSELAQALGIDAVVLGPTQAAQGLDYEALGWRQTSSSPLTFVNPAPSGLATAWPSGQAILVVGADQRSAANPYNDLVERATTGMIPYATGWLVRGQSAYIDDYSTADLSRYPALVLLGYRYHDRTRAWGLVDDYVRAGGSLYVDTGWQYVDPDWDLGSPAPSVLPVNELRWGALDPSAPVMASGVPTGSWGAMTYGSSSAGWGASSAGAASVRQGAQPLVTVGGRVVVAREQVGRGRVVWSGMNLIAHAAGAGSSAEDSFVAGLFSWLLGDATSGAQTDLGVTWLSDDQSRLDLTSRSGPSWVLFKESSAPGWSARLQWPDSPGISSGSRSVPILDGELDFMLVRLDSVPPGAQLVFTYGPTLGVYGSWALSALSLAALMTWVVRPNLYRRLLLVLARVRDRTLGRLVWREDDV
jgi:hypothetical protein